MCSLCLSISSSSDDEVRNVFDAFRLELLYDKEARGVTIRVTVSERTVAALRLGGDRRLVTTQAAGGPARPFLFFCPLEESNLHQPVKSRLLCR
jgi:hypothetical protein